MNEKIIEWRLLKDQGGVFFVQIFKSGFRFWGKDSWNYIRRYEFGFLSRIKGPRLTFKSEEEAQQYMRDNCKYNPAIVLFMQHPSITLS